MKSSRKYIAALAVIAAGSVFYGVGAADAKPIEIDRVDIVLKREHDAPPPQPQPQHYEPRGHMSPPPGPSGPRHMPPPQPQHYREFGPRDHMPPSPPPGPRGPRPPMPPRRW